MLENVSPEKNFTEWLPKPTPILTIFRKHLLEGLMFIDLKGDFFQKQIIFVLSILSI